MRVTAVVLILTTSVVIGRGDNRSSPEIRYLGPVDGSAAMLVLKLPPSDFSGLNGSDRKVLSDLDQKTRDVLASSQFQAELLAISGLDDGHQQGSSSSLTGAQIRLLIFNLDPSRPRLPVSYALRTRHKGTPGLTGTWNDVATVTLNREVLDEAQRGGDALGCAINTLAHEWTHAIPHMPHSKIRNDEIFTDGKHNHDTAPLVSYSIGALAQCIANKSADVRACVQTVGTTTYTCSD